MTRDFMAIFVNRVKRRRNLFCTIGPLYANADIHIGTGAHQNLEKISSP